MIEDRIVREAADEEPTPPGLQASVTLRPRSRFLRDPVKVTRSKTRDGAAVGCIS